MNFDPDLDLGRSMKRPKLEFKEKIQQWKRQRENICASTSTNSLTNLSVIDSIQNDQLKNIESKLIDILCDQTQILPLDFLTLQSANFTDNQTVKNLLKQFSSQKLIELKHDTNDGVDSLLILSINHEALKLMKNGEDSLQHNESSLLNDSNELNEKEFDSLSNKNLDNSDELNRDSIECILSLQSTKEKENKKTSEELCLLLSKPTAKEKSLAEQFRSSSGQVQEFCAHGTRSECMRVRQANVPCSKLHFLKIIQKHTDESLGDCSFLNTCFHMDSCKYVHYKVETKNSSSNSSHCNNNKNDPTSSSSNSTAPLVKTLATATEQPFKRVLFPPQWIRCDLRFFDMSILGLYSLWITQTLY